MPVSISTEYWEPCYCYINYFETLIEDLIYNYSLALSLQFYIFQIRELLRPFSERGLFNLRLVST